MEIIGGTVYDHKKEDCPYALSLALQKKYKHIPKLGCMISNTTLITKMKSGLKKHGMKLKQLHKGKKITLKELPKLLEYLVHNERDGFFVLEHTNPVETRHLFAFLYNRTHKTLDFFDSYNCLRVLCTLRMDKHNIEKFIKDVFDDYFRKEFAIEKCFEFET
jgi:hypothetical protein